VHLFVLILLPTCHTIVWLWPASSGMRNSRPQNEHILRMKFFIPELAGLPGMWQFHGYDKVQCFIFIPFLEWLLSVLGRGWGYNKVRPKGTKDTKTVWWYLCTEYRVHMIAIFFAISVILTMLTFCFRIPLHWKSITPMLNAASKDF